MLCVVTSLCPVTTYNSWLWLVGICVSHTILKNSFDVYTLCGVLSVSALTVCVMTLSLSVCLFVTLCTMHWASWCPVTLVHFFDTRKYCVEISTVFTCLTYDTEPRSDKLAISQKIYNIISEIVEGWTYFQSNTHPLNIAVSMSLTFRIIVSKIFRISQLDTVSCNEENIHGLLCSLRCLN